MTHKACFAWKVFSLKIGDWEKQISEKKDVDGDCFTGEIIKRYLDSNLASSVWEKQLCLKQIAVIEAYFSSVSKTNQKSVFPDVFLSLAKLTYQRPAKLYIGE